LGLLKNKSEDEIFDLKSKELNNGVRTPRSRCIGNAAC
jgi:hypothetical protein